MANYPTCFNPLWLSGRVNIFHRYFSQYSLNDFERFLLSKGNGLNFTSDLVYDHLQDEDTITYLKIITFSMLMIQLFLLNSLNVLNEYCNIWDLKVNASKTKIIIFSRGKVKKLPVFTLNDDNIDIVDNYKYLGIIKVARILWYYFSVQCNFSKAPTHLYDQASKAMFSLIAKCRKCSLPINVQLDLFDCLVRPI